MKISYLAPAASWPEKTVKIELDEKTKTDRFVVVDKTTSKLILGIGKRKDMTRRKLQLLPRRIVRISKHHKLKKIAVTLSDFSFPNLRLAARDVAEILAVNFTLANFDFVHYKTAPAEGWDMVEDVIILGPSNPSVDKAIARGQIIGNEVNDARILANTPGGDMTPELLALAAHGATRKLGIKVKVLELEDMKKLGMGGILGVAKGSTEKPKFIILEYAGKKTGRPIVLVGKGVTFDTGGLNLKPGDSMLEMNMDMSGGAAVIHAICALAALKVKKNVVGLIPAVENMPSGESYRPGDILKSMSGKTIEVLNTDAEGRIILADALTYAKKFNPRVVIDIATLTGAALVALGQRASALFTTDPELEKKLRQAGEDTLDPVWPLPLWSEYDDEIKGTFGDVANVGKTRYGGAITGAAFLHQFTKDYPWAHIDMAPRMTAIEGEYLAKGSVGATVRLLTRFVENF